MYEIVELETVAHWWCRRCGRWEVCDDRDHCIECTYVAAGQPCGDGMPRQSLHGGPRVDEESMARSRRVVVLNAPKLATGATPAEERR